MVDFKCFKIGLALIALLFSCTEINIQKENVELEEKFNLEADIFRFSDRLKEGDTLRIIANLSNCTSWRVERNVFYKNGFQTMMELSVEGEFVTEDELRLPTVKYPSSGHDSLSFEHLLKGLKEHQPIKGKGSIYLVIHDSDTMRFGATGLIEIMKTANHYRKIKRSLYPQSDLYKEIIAPIEE